MKIFFNQLFEFNFHCNNKLIKACNEMNEVPEKSITLFSHIINVHQRWNAVLTETAPKYDLFQIQEIKYWADIANENQRKSIEIISNTHDFDTLLNYENSKGQLHKNRAQDVLFHIINHSTHHRGQISTDFRQHDIEPIPFSYTSFTR